MQGKKYVYVYRDGDGHGGVSHLGCYSNLGSVQR